MPNARYRFIQEVAQLPGVRSKLDRVRDAKAAQAAALAAREGLQVPIQVSSGTRPKGRPYARIAIRAVDEFGDSKTKRSRLLGRVVR
jgi:hypothetical protein